MATNPTKPIVLTIAGIDPTGVAGILSDLKTFAAHDCYGVAAATAVTVQNTCETRRIVPVDAEVVEQQIQTLFDDVAIAGVKIGLLGGRKNMDAVARRLAAHRGVPILVDVVMRLANGIECMGQPEVEVFKRTILPLARVVTTSAADAERLLGLPVRTLEEMKGAAKLLYEQGPPHVVITGSHLERAADVDYDGQELQVFTSPRAELQHLNGVGCTFAAAIVANLVHGKGARESVVLAKAYVHQAVTRAYPVGNGRGALNHLFRFAESQARPAVAPEPVAEPSH